MKCLPLAHLLLTTGLLLAPGACSPPGQGAAKAPTTPGPATPEPARTAAPPPKTASPPAKTADPAKTAAPAAPAPTPAAKAETPAAAKTTSPPAPGPKPSTPVAAAPPPPPKRNHISMYNSCNKPVRLIIKRSGSDLHTSLNTSTRTDQSATDGDVIQLMDETDRKELHNLTITASMKEVVVLSGCGKLEGR